MLVIDCSVSLAWFFQVEHTQAALGMLDHARDQGMCIPSLWWREMTNGFLLAERCTRITEADTRHYLSLLEKLPITVDDLPVRQGVADALTLGRRYGLTAYDAAYLELAMRRGIPLATFDQSLSAAGENAGVTVLKPN
jgi:predicted nucleic acid-binding protein